MKRDEVEELLLQWELARQAGRDLSAERLCEHTPHLEEVLKECIQVLQKTSWMLDDPAADMLDAEIENSVSALVRKADTCAMDSTHRNLSEERQQRGNSSEPLPTVPGFKLIREIGRGGFGVVYEAMDNELNRRVAIKLPILDNPRFHERYIREARHAALFDVPGIVPVLQVGRTSEGCPFVVQKLIVGMSLADILSRGGKLSAAQTVTMMASVCESVGAAHEQSLIHRDLKPANILVDATGTPWVSDLGLAITEEDQPFHEGEVAGTPSYMAPEQIQGHVDLLDGRTDIWALGVILYQCLTGTLPFKAPVRLQLHRQILEHDARPICQRSPQLHAHWDTVFQKCCAKLPKDRYKSALELKHDLLSIETTVGITSGNSSNPLLLDLLPSDGEARTVSTREVSDAKPKHLSYALRGFSISLVILFVIVGLVAVLQRLPRRDADVALEPGEEISQRADREGRVEPSQKPLLVSAQPGNAYQTLAGAIAAARPGQEILVASGIYRESLKLVHDVRIRSQSAEDQVTIVGVAGPAFVVPAGTSLNLTGVSIATDDDQQEFNAIDVQGGALILNDCEVSASKFDCVRLSPESSLTAELCRFQSTRHPAIYANSVKQLEVRKCQFELESTDSNEANLILVGIQAKQSGGYISECQFSGSQATAIEWSDSLEPVVVTDCSFKNLKRGLTAFACEHLKLGAIQESRFERCGIAIQLENCGGNINNCVITGGKIPGSTGIRARGAGVAENSGIEIRSCQLSDLESAVLLSQARVEAALLTVQAASNSGVVLLDNTFLTLSESKILGSDVFGMLLENSVARLERCEIAGSGVAGVVVDGLENAFEADGSWINENAVGIILMSGSVKLKHGEVRDNDTGLLAARKHLLKHNRTCDAELQVIAEQVKFDARIHALRFLSPASYQISRCTLLDSADGKPLLADGLTESVQGDTTLVVESRP